MKRVFLALILTVVLFAGDCGASRPAGGKTSFVSPQQMLLRDEGLSQLSYVDLDHPERNWYVPIPAGRDLQLVGEGRVLIGTGEGYEVHDIKTGQKTGELTGYKGTVAARRLRNGNTLLTGLNWQGKSGIVLVEVDGSGAIVRTIVYAGFEYVRLVRETATGNFLVTADDVVFEGNSKGEVVWRTNLATRRKSQHAWQAVQLANGRTVVSGGFSASLQFLDKNHSVSDTIGGPVNVRPYFYSGFQILKSGHLVVANWQGHGREMGSKGNQILEYDPAGKLVWAWQQDPTRFSSVQGVIVLDGLDLNLPHTEGKNGYLEAF